MARLQPLVRLLVYSWSLFVSDVSLFARCALMARLWSYGPWFVRQFILGSASMTFSLVCVVSAGVYVS